MKKNILLITPNLIAGGSQRVMLNLFDKLKKKNVTLFIYKKNSLFFNINKKDPKIIFSKSKRVLLSFFEINNLIRKKKFHVILTSGRGMNVIIGIFSYFFKKKIDLIFREANTMDEFHNKNIKNYIRLYMMKIAYFKAKYIIANSIDTKKDLIKYKIVNKKKIYVIPNPINVNNNNLDDLTNLKKFISQKFIIIGCGSLTYQKNFQLLINAYNLFQKKIPNSCLLILGNGPMKNELNDLINKYNLKHKIKCLGPIKNPFSIFCISNMFVLSSRFEGFGNVVVEAMFAGLQIISTRCRGGPVEILKKGKFGYLSKNDDIKDLYNKMLMSYKKPKKYNVQNIIKKYSSSSISSKYYSLITK